MSWSTVVAAIKLTGNLGLSKDYHSALSQLWSCADSVFAVQPRRDIFFGIVGDGCSVEVVRFQRGPALQVQRTGPQSLSLDKNSPGLRMLARLLTAPPQDLGFVPPTKCVGRCQ